MSAKSRSRISSIFFYTFCIYQSTQNKQRTNCWTTLIFFFLLNIVMSFYCTFTMRCWVVTVQFKTVLYRQLCGNQDLSTKVTLSSCQLIVARLIVWWVKSYHEWEQLHQLRTTIVLFIDNGITMLSFIFGRCVKCYQFLLCQWQPKYKNLFY